LDEYLKYLGHDKQKIMLPIHSIIDKINPLDQNESKKTEFFLALDLGEKSVKAGLWGLSDNQSEIIAFGSTENWGGENSDDLVVATDASISSAISKVSLIKNNKPPEKIIFGLSDNWVEEDGIKKTKLDLIKKAFQKLSLKAIGFVVTQEAITYYLKKNEGGFPSVILLSIGETEAVVSLIIKGKYLGSKVVGRSDSLALDLEEGLLRFGLEESLPSRIIIFNEGTGEDIESLKQNLIAYQWTERQSSKKLNFIQLPSVEIGDENIKINAIVMAGSRDMGYEVVKNNMKIVTEIEREKEIDEVVVEEKTPPSFTTEEKDNGKGEDNISSEKISDEIKQEDFPQENFDFLSERDIQKENPKIEETADSKKEISADIVTNSTEDFSSYPKESEVVPVNIESVSSTEINEITKTKKIHFPRINIFSFLGRIFKKPKPAVATNFHSKFVFPRFIIFGVLIIILIASIFSAGFYFLCYADVRLLFQPLEAEKSLDFTISSKIQLVDKTKMVIPAKEVLINLTGESSSKVLGRKTVGDKAVGEITVYNRSDQTKTIPKGSVIKGPSNLKFILNEEVKIASKTADLQQGIDKWGEAKGTVTAGDIGAQYNLAALSSLVFEQISQSTILIKNQNAFSGGSSREILAVSKADRDELRKKLLKELEAKAKEEIPSKITTEDYLLLDSLYLKTNKDTYDKEVNEEADMIALNEEAQFGALYFSKNDFRILIENLFSPLDLNGYGNQPTKEIYSFEVKDKAKLVFSGKAVWEFSAIIDEKYIKNTLKGEKLSEAESKLKDVSRLSKINISIRPKMFAYFNRIPLKESNINLLIDSSF